MSVGQRTLLVLPHIENRMKLLLITGNNRKAARKVKVERLKRFMLKWILTRKMPAKLIDEALFFFSQMIFAFLEATNFVCVCVVNI